MRRGGVPLAYRLRVVNINAIMANRFADRVGSLGRDLLAGFCAAIVFCGHLREQTIPQTQG